MNYTTVRVCAEDRLLPEVYVNFTVSAAVWEVVEKSRSWAKFQELVDDLMKRQVRKLLKEAGD